MVREYLDVFAACGRGENEPATLLAYYGVPLSLSTDDGFVALTTDAAVVSMAQRQVEGMRASEYARDSGRAHQPPVRRVT